LSFELEDVPADLQMVVAATLVAAGLDDGHLSVEFVDEARIRELNAAHRGRDEPTDVLSFPVDGSEATDGPRELGDVVVCLRHTDDATEATVHGVLHLCGYDHECDDGEMLVLQERILSSWVVGSPADDVREARPDEVGALVRCYEWLFAAPGSKPPQWDPEAAVERLRVAIDSEAAAVLVATSGDRIRGFCTAYIDLLSVRFGVRCWVEDLAVDPSFRSQGTGRELLSAARGWAAARGASHLELDSGEARLDAHRFYEREGAQGRSISFGWYGLERSP